MQSIVAWRFDAEGGTYDLVRGFLPLWVWCSGPVPARSKSAVSRTIPPLQTPMLSSTNTRASGAPAPVLVRERPTDGPPAKPPWVPQTRALRMALLIWGMVKDTLVTNHRPATTPALLEVCMPARPSTVLSALRACHPYSCPVPTCPIIHDADSRALMCVAPSNRQAGLVFSDAQ